MLEFASIPGALDLIPSHTWLMPEDWPDEAFPMNDFAVRETIEEVLGSLAAAERMIGSIASRMRHLERRLS